jgi:hypothetical protein
MGSVQFHSELHNALEPWCLALDLLSGIKSKSKSKSKRRFMGIVQFH